MNTDPRHPRQEERLATTAGPRRSLPAAHMRGWGGELMTWASCYSTPLEFQAHLVKGYLEQYGVPCLLEHARFGMKPLTFGALGEIRILVREDWLQVAQ